MIDVSVLPNADDTRYMIINENMILVKIGEDFVIRK